MRKITNPILPGFHPDPSICKAGSTYYIATSTFDWYPGVEINASENLSDWRLAARPLSRASQLDMRGNGESCGVWAPSLSWADNTFWLIYTDVKRHDSNYKDAHNYLVTAPAIEGPWSDPVYLNSSGFDPSLFHDDDGTKWLVNMQWDFRGPLADIAQPGSPFAGILLQQYDTENRRLSGDTDRIFLASERGMSEAPHLFKYNDWYFLILAEGGTGYNHAVTHARSRQITGPYQLHPDIHPLKSPPSIDSNLQRIGHGQFVMDDNEDVWHTFLCSRPLPGTQRSPLGRETAIAKCRWDNDDWLRVVEMPAVADSGFHQDEQQHSFADGFPDEFQWLRTPYPERLWSVDENPGWLRLFGRESIGSFFEQALVARRQTGWRYSAKTRMRYKPRDFQSQAGLITYYNRYQYHFLSLTATSEGETVIIINSCLGDYPQARVTFPIESGLKMSTEDDVIELGVDVDLDELRFRWRSAGKEWQFVGPVLDASILSDEAGHGEHANFTGAFVGVAAYDGSGQALSADFSDFHYCNRKEATVFEADDS